jgi:hypothetical protein
MLPLIGVRSILPVLVSLTLSAWGAESIVGSVKTAQGGVVVRRGTETIPASQGMHLLLNDILLTSGDGRVGAILQDGTCIGLGPNTELKIDRFVYEPVDGKFGLLLRLAKGVLVYFSGRIARLAPEAVTVETPVGVVGLRGTHFAISIEGT